VGGRLDLGLQVSFLGEGVEAPLEVGVPLGHASKRRDASPTRMVCVQVQQSGDACGVVAETLLGGVRNLGRSRLQITAVQVRVMWGGPACLWYVACGMW
jgi:hypothetical protein